MATYGASGFGTEAVIRNISTVVTVTSGGGGGGSSGPTTGQLWPRLG